MDRFQLHDQIEEILRNLGVDSPGEFSMNQVYAALPYGVLDKLTPVQLLDRDPYDGPTDWLVGELTILHIKTSHGEYIRHSINGYPVDVNTLKEVSRLNSG